MRGRGERSEREKGRKVEKGRSEERKERGATERKVGREKGRGVREERRRTEEKGNGGMGKGRSTRNCWASELSVHRGGSMCSVCPASPCVGAKVEACSCLAAFAGDCGESTLPCWRNRCDSTCKEKREEGPGKREEADGERERDR
jgi:hypothetical protein